MSLVHSIDSMSSDMFACCVGAGGDGNTGAL